MANHMRDAGEMPLSRRASDVPEDAIRQPQHLGGEQPTITGSNDSEWSNLIDSLMKVRDNLQADNTGADTNNQRLLQTAISQVRAFWTQAKRNRSPVEERLRRIEEKLTPKVERKIGGAEPRSWATVAAQGAAQAMRDTNAPIINRPAVRLRIPEAKDKSPEELLAAIKPMISAAYAVRVLRSGDVEAMVPSQQAKDRILSQAIDTENIKVLRQDYPVEVWGVPLAIKVASGREADNRGLIQAIRNTSKHITNLAINKIRWLHAPKAHAARQEAGKTRGTLIISLPTQAMQHDVIRKGLVINGELFEAHLHEHGTEIRQCFRCSSWGHTQAACGRRVTCGQCAGAHQTKDCPKERTSCTNCGKSHKAWQRAACRTFKSFLETIQARRSALQARTAVIRCTSTGVAQTAEGNDGFTFVAPRKRGRQHSEDRIEEQRRPVGRPPYGVTAVRNAAKDRSQSVLSVARRDTSASPVIRTNVGEKEQGNKTDTEMQ